MSTGRRGNPNCAFCHGSGCSVCIPMYDPRRDGEDSGPTLKGCCNFITCLGVLMCLVLAFVIVMQSGR